MVVLLSVNKLVVQIIFIIIPIVVIIFFILLTWEHAPIYCYTNLNGTANAVISNLNTCINECWKKHDFGSDIIIDDCYIINVWIQDRIITNSEIEKLNKNVKIYWENQLDPKTEYVIKIRYNYTGNEISLIKVE